MKAVNVLLMLKLIYTFARHLYYKTNNNYDLERASIHD